VAPRGAIGLDWKRSDVEKVVLSDRFGGYHRAVYAGVHGLAKGLRKQRKYFRFSRDWARGSITREGGRY
jgi:hypothetical protein